MEEKTSILTDDIKTAMEGFCPKCSSIITEEKTNEDPEEWTITCPICDFCLVFG